MKQNQHGRQTGIPAHITGFIFSIPGSGWWRNILLYIYSCSVQWLGYSENKTAGVTAPASVGEGPCVSLPRRKQQSTTEITSGRIDWQMGHGLNLGESALWGSWVQFQKHGGSGALASGNGFTQDHTPSVHSLGTYPFHFGSQSSVRSLWL